MKVKAKRAYRRRFIVENPANTITLESTHFVLFRSLIKTLDSAYKLSVIGNNKAAAKIIYALREDGNGYSMLQLLAQSLHSADAATTTVERNAKLVENAITPQ